MRPLNPTCSSALLGGRDFAWAATRGCGWCSNTTLIVRLLYLVAAMAPSTTRSPTLSGRAAHLSGRGKFHVTPELQARPGA